MKANSLLISQDIELTERMAKVLISEGHDVSVCTRPREVISVIREKAFDVVLLDVHMRDAPYEKIVEVIKKVVPAAVMVLITSYAFPDAARTDQPEIAIYLVQPLTEDKIKNAVNRALHQVSLSQENRRLLSTVTAAKQQWEATVDAIDDPIFLTDFDYSILRANLATYRKLGRGVDDVLGKKCYEIFHCSDHPLDDCPGKRAMLSGEMTSDVLRFKGLRQKLSCDVYPQVFSGGGLVHHLHAPTISYETQAEMMTTYERVFDEAAVPILLIDVDDYKVVDANQRALEFFAREPERMFNTDLENLFAAAEAETLVNNILKQHEAGSSSFRSTVIDGRGKEKEVYIVLNSINVRSRLMAEILVVPVDLLG
ncbi:MAG: PAS domain-containing protein [candidate division WOR-3 bacterium]